MAAITGMIFSAASAFATAASAESAQRIRIRMGDQAVTATPCFLCPSDMRDHLRREKTGPLPWPLSERTEASPNYQSGDLGFWRPGGNFVIFYRHDGLTIPSPGIVLLRRVDSGAELFDVPGQVEVTVELIK
jgi:hypothetical protein